MDNTYAEHEPAVMAFIRAGLRRCGCPADLVEDMLQEARIGIVLALPEYDPAKGASLRTFLCGRAWGAVQHAWRDRYQWPVHVVPLDEVELAVYDEPVEFRLDVDRAIGASHRSARNRTILRLRLVDEKPLKEVARSCGVSKDRVSKIVENFCFAYAHPMSHASATV